MFGAIGESSAAGSSAGGGLGDLLGGQFGSMAFGGALGALGNVLNRRSAKKQRKQLEDMIRKRTATEGVLASDAAQSAVNDAKQGLRETYGDIDGSLIDRGMYNSTVRDSLRSGATSDLARVIGGIRSRAADRVNQINASGYDQLLSTGVDEDPIGGQIGQLAYLALQRQPRLPSEDDPNAEQTNPGGVGAQVAGDVERQMSLAGLGGGPLGGGGTRNLALARAYLNGRHNPGGD